MYRVGSDFTLEWITAFSELLVWKLQFVFIYLINLYSNTKITILRNFNEIKILN